MRREFKACRERICGIRGRAGINGPGDPRGEDVEDFATPVGRRKWPHATAVARVAAWRRFVHAVSPFAGGHRLCLHEGGKVSQRTETPE